MNAINAISPKFDPLRTIIRKLNIKSDEDIIVEYKRTRNKRLLSPLFKKYSEKLFGLAYYYLNEKEMAMDSVMEAYEVVLRSLDTKEISYYKGWLMSICRNICLKKIRDGKKFSELTEVADSFVENESDLVYSDETIESVLELIPQLKDHQRICVEAFYLQNKSYEEICKSHEMTFKQVKSHIQNGKRNLKLLYERKSKALD